MSQLIAICLHIKHINNKYYAYSTFMCVLGKTEFDESEGFRFNKGDKPIMQRPLIMLISG